MPRSKRLIRSSPSNTTLVLFFTTFFFSFEWISPIFHFLDGIDKQKAAGTSALKAEKVFKDLSTAYAVLNDNDQKEKYDKEWAEWMAMKKAQGL